MNAVYQSHITFEITIILCERRSFVVIPLPLPRPRASFSFPHHFLWAFVSFERGQHLASTWQHLLYANNSNYFQWIPSAEQNSIYYIVLELRFGLECSVCRARQCMYKIHPTSSHTHTTHANSTKSCLCRPKRAKKSEERTLAPSTMHNIVYTQYTWNRKAFDF